jgi:hypothetical protein
MNKIIRDVFLPHRTLKNDKWIYFHPFFGLIIELLPLMLLLALALNSRKIEEVKRTWDVHSLQLAALVFSHFSQFFILIHQWPFMRAEYNFIHKTLINLNCTFVWWSSTKKKKTLDCNYSCYFSIAPESALCFW